MPFLPQYDKQAATILRKAGFSATEISKFLGCSNSWVNSKVNTTTDLDFQQVVMQLILNTYHSKVENAN